MPHFVLLCAQAPALLLSALGVVQHDSVSVGDRQCAGAIFTFCRCGYARFTACENLPQSTRVPGKDARRCCDEEMLVGGKHEAALRYWGGL